MTDENKIEFGMADFARRARESLVAIPESKPFVVRVDEQRTELSPRQSVALVSVLDEEQAQVLAPPAPGLTAVSPNLVTSAGGTSVTITGSNFVSGATVKIAGISASSVVFVNSTTITCITPANGLGYVNVEVTNPSGQTVTNGNLLQYTDFPDNFVLQGQHEVAGYQGCALGPNYVYTVTARLGTLNFTPPPGVTVYAWIGLYQDSGSCGLENPFPVIITNATGPTVSRNCAFAIRAVTPGSYGSATIYFAIWASRDGSIGTRFPTYGDSTYQPTAFRVNITGNGPPPVGGGSSEFFSWSGVNPNANRSNPWSWDPGEGNPFHPITIKRLHPDGTVNTSYTGTASITLTPHPNPGGLLQVSYPSTRTFVAGIATFDLRAEYTYSAAGNPQVIAYFHLTATEGAISNNSPTCGALNHL